MFNNCRAILPKICIYVEAIGHPPIVHYNEPQKRGGGKK